MIGTVLSGSVLGMLAGAGCLVAGMPVVLALAVWSGTGTLAVFLAVLLSIRPRRRAVPATLQRQRA